MANLWDGVLQQRHGDKLKPESKATASSATTETEAQIAERVRAEEVQRVNDITAACSIANKPERAGGFIASGKKLAEVLAVLDAERASNGAQRKGEAVADFNARRGRQI